MNNDEFSQCPCGRCTGDSMDEDPAPVDKEGADSGSLFRICIIAMSSPYSYEAECSANGIMGMDVFYDKELPALVHELTTEILSGRSKSYRGSILEDELLWKEGSFCTTEKRRRIFAYCKAASARCVTR